MKNLTCLSAAVARAMTSPAYAPINPALRPRDLAKPYEAVIGATIAVRESGEYNLSVRCSDGASARMPVRLDAKRPAAAMRRGASCTSNR